MSAAPIGSWPKEVEQQVQNARRLAAADFPHSAAIALRDAARMLDGGSFLDDLKLAVRQPPYARLGLDDPEGRS